MITTIVIDMEETFMEHSHIDKNALIEALEDAAYDELVDLSDPNGDEVWFEGNKLNIITAEGADISEAKLNAVISKALCKVR